MQGSMRWVVAVIVTTLSLVIGLSVISASQAAPLRTTCSDLGYLNMAIKSSKKSTAALKLATQGRYAAALKPAQTALWYIKHSPQPCDRGTEDYWLHRQYSIRYSVALVRYFEEMREGDEDRADVYWSSVEFWGDEITDITYGW